MWKNVRKLCLFCFKFLINLSGFIRFVSAGRLTTHINVAHMLHGQDYICHICAKQFACRSNLTYHLTTHQPKVRQVQCEKCGKW